MSPADTECTAESVSAVFLRAINSPVMQQHPQPSLPARDQGELGEEASGGRRGERDGEEGWERRVEEKGKAERGPAYLMSCLWIA